MVINRLSLIAAIILVFRIVAYSQDNTAIYIEKHKTLSVDLMQEFSIPASVILGIAVIESGAGTSALSRKFNNHFGIVGKNYNAVKKFGHHSYYKEYPSDSASFRHFCEVIAHKPFYAKLRSNPDYNAWIKAIRKSGYASSANSWSARVVYAIERFNLSAVDLFIDPLNETARLFPSDE